MQQRLINTNLRHHKQIIISFNNRTSDLKLIKDAQQLIIFREIMPKL